MDGHQSCNFSIDQGSSTFLVFRFVVKVIQTVLIQQSCGVI